MRRQRRPLQEMKVRFFPYFFPYPLCTLHPRPRMQSISRLHRIHAPAICDPALSSMQERSIAQEGMTIYNRCLQLDISSGKHEIDIILPSMLPDLPDAGYHYDSFNLTFSSMLYILPHRHTRAPSPFSIRGGSQYPGLKRSIHFMLGIVMIYCFSIGL